MDTTTWIFKAVSAQLPAFWFGIGMAIKKYGWGCLWYWKGSRGMHGWYGIPPNLSTDALFMAIPIPNQKAGSSALPVLKIQVVIPYISNMINKCPFYEHSFHVIFLSEITLLALSEWRG